MWNGVNFINGIYIWNGSSGKTVNAPNIWNGITILNYVNVSNISIGINFPCITNNTNVSY